MNQFRSLLRDTGQWVGKDLAVFWLPTLPILIAVEIIRLYGESEPSIRITGMVLQILALVPLVQGIIQIREIYELPGFRNYIKGVWERRPRLKKNMSLQSSMVSKFTGYSSGLTMRKPINPDDSLEKRIEALEYNIHQMEIDFKEQIASERESIRKIHGEINAKIDEQGRSSKKLELNVKSIHIDGIILSAAGIIWLFFGIFLSSTSVELHGLFGTSTGPMNSGSIKIVSPVEHAPGQPFRQRLTPC